VLVAGGPGAGAFAAVVVVVVGAAVLQLLLLRVVVVVVGGKSNWASSSLSGGSQVTTRNQCPETVRPQSCHRAGRHLQPPSPLRRKALRPTTAGPPRGARGRRRGGGGAGGVGPHPDGPRSQGRRPGGGIGGSRSPLYSYFARVDSTTFVLHGSQLRFREFLDK